LAALPQDNALDNTLPLLWQGYRFISNKCTEFNSDIFQTRLLLRKVVCMKGAEAAQLFYDNDRFLRHGAMPIRAQKTLVGLGGVQGLDGQAHQHRKKLFVSQLMDPTHIQALVDLHRAHWQAAISTWQMHQDIIFFDEAQKILCKSVCEWAGVPLPESDLNRRATEFGLMIDSGARIGIHHWRGRLARHSSEQWITEEIHKVRASGSEAITSIMAAFAWHRDENGALLPAEIAAVELINVLRPTVAIAQLAAFCALAIHQHREVREKLGNNATDYLDWFVLEVRRFYPFFPFLAAYTRHDFTWKGWAFKKGTLTLLDIYGTNHDQRLWQDPEVFRPERFEHWDHHRYDFIANGGGTYEQHHRCPGEWITNALMKVIIQVLVEGDLSYEMPEQDLRFSLSDIPTLPKSRVIIRPINVRTPATGLAS
jgi:fatty-acid peroxygenase